MSILDVSYNKLRITNNNTWCLSFEQERMQRRCFWDSHLEVCWNDDWWRCWYEDEKQEGGRNPFQLYQQIPGNDDADSLLNFGHSEIPSILDNEVFSCLY